MKHKAIIISSLMTLIMTGCASTGDSEYVYVVDEERVNYINQAATHSPYDVNVYWVNRPKKKVKRADVEKDQSPK
ncbi:MAG: hypothetical protein V2I33_13155 [Kangiellaceae bacterium]|jgi:hypothetical protein|nr:hypothetical protein [Kangiellaceae bacterium]